MKAGDIQKLKTFEKLVSKRLQSQSVTPGNIESRVKNIDSKITEIPHDFYGLRYIFKNKKTLSLALNVIQNSFRVTRVKNFYSNPHPQEPTYRAIHLNIEIYQERNIEIQIKTLREHNRAVRKIQLLGHHYWKK